ncbi:collagenase 3-like [Diadema antillarum]|uniref:collagenase 3-like n=1 Tax=Diadema antillarum TaxID=105358 RepID=UPI003A89BF81
MALGLSLILIACALAVTGADRVDTPEEAMAYLNKYQYLQTSEMKDGMPMTNDIYVQVIKYFQEFNNMTVTGELDEATYALMNMPRCGMPDMSEDREKDMVRRKKRYSLSDQRWPRNELTWRINSRTPDLSASAVDQIMERALKVWSDVSALSFTKVTSGDADIIIDFVRGRHTALDPNDFDGPGNVLAHAFFPNRFSSLAGDAHFDEDEMFTENTNRGINLFQVAAHEFGHSLGLGHSQIQAALMAPYYRGYVPNFELHEDDIAGIQAHYGPNVGVPEEMGTPLTPVENCMGDVSFVTRTQDGSVYIGVGTQVFRRVNGQLVAGYPKPISEEFPGLPNELDAAFFYEPWGRTYVFRGAQYWRLTNRNIDRGFPRSIADFRGLPSDLSSAFVWSGNGRVYLTKGNQYYRLSTYLRRVDQGYPRPLAVWGGLPSTVDAAFQDSNRFTYFFSGLNYYRFDDRTFQVDSGYPQSAAVMFLQCDPAELELESSTPTSDAALTIPSLLTLVLPALMGFVYSH